MPPAVDLQCASKAYTDPSGARRWAIRDVSWIVDTGGRWGLLGENGAGKSTLARLLVGLEQPDEGRVVLFGTDTRTSGRLERRRWPRLVQIVWQDPLVYLNPYLTVQQLIGEVIPGRNDGGGPGRDVGSVMDLARLPDDLRRRRPHESSGGQCQRVALARALAPKPRLLVFDEALTGLDLPIQLSILDTLQDLQRSLAFTYVFVSHDLSLVARMCDARGDGRRPDRGGRSGRRRARLTVPPVHGAAARRRAPPALHALAGPPPATPREARGSPVTVIARREQSAVGARSS